MRAASRKLPNMPTASIRSLTLYRSLPSRLCSEAAKKRSIDAAMGSDQSPRWPIVAEASKGGILLFFPRRLYVGLALSAGGSVAVCYLVLGLFLWNRIGPSLYLLGAIALGGVSIAYFAGRVANLLVGPMWSRLTLERPREVVSVSVLRADPVRVRGWSRLPITFKGSISYLWIHADPAEVSAFIGLALSGSADIDPLVRKQSD